jgi:hypothetical protein
MNQKNVVFIHNEVLLSYEEEQNVIIRKEMYGTGEHHSERG